MSTPREKVDVLSWEAYNRTHLGGVSLGGHLEALEGAMKTTADYIDALRVKFNLDSDFKAMNMLGVKHRQQVSEWRKLHSAFGEELSIKVADALEIDRAEVLLAMQVQKESNIEIKKLWERIATLSLEHRALAASLLAAVGVLVVVFGGSTDQTLLLAMTAPVGNSVYYVKWLVLQYWPLFAVLFALWLVAFHWYHPNPQKEQPHHLPN